MSVQKVYIDPLAAMYVAGRDHPHRLASRRVLADVREGRIYGCSSTFGLEEILFRYVGLGRRDLAQKVYQLFAEICDEIFPTSLADTDRASTMLFRVEGISPRAALHAALMQRHGVERIFTLDPAFRGVPGVKPYEP